MRFETNKQPIHETMNTSHFEIAHTHGTHLPVKASVAAYLREEIISGRLAPGERIVEIKWAKQLKMSQSSIREALNILSGEGFVQKGAGRTAQVTKLSEKDIQNSYELRAVLEGYAARVVSQKRADLSRLDQALADMRSAIDCSNLRAFYERDLQFHLLLAELTDNRMLVESVKRIIVPLFSFVVMRVQAARAEPQQWMSSFEQHRRILDAVRTGDPVFAERLVVQAIGAFLNETSEVIGAGKVSESIMR